MPIKRRIARSGFLHICQKTADNGLLFYTVEDFLVFFTLLCVMAEAHGIVIFAIVLMFNHIHLGAFFRSVKAASAFMNGALSVYARLYNKQHGLTGQLFKKPFKSAPKTNEKKIRDNLFYIWNNPVEKNAVSTAEEYRWNFLKYMESDHPFSEPIILSEVSDDLLKLMRKVNEKRESGKLLGYGFFDKTFKSLSKKERMQLIDYIIVKYNTIDKGHILGMFGSYQSLVLAVNSVAGNEYDLLDDLENEDYRHYVRMIGILRDEGVSPNAVCFNRSRSDPNSATDELLLSKLRRRLKTEVGATDYEIAKFLHQL